MKLCWLAVLLLLAATLSAIAKRRGQTSMTAPFEAGKEASKPDFKEVFSKITPTSFTQTLYQGEAGRDLKRLLTIQRRSLTKVLNTRNGQVVSS